MKKLLIALSLPVMLQAETLQDAVSSALQNNPTVLAAQFAREAAREDAKAARGGLRPVAGLTALAGPQMRDRSTEGISSSGDWLFARQADLSVRQLLFDAKATKNRSFSAEDLSAAEEMTEGETKERVALAVTEAYLDVLRLQELIHAAEKNLTQHREALNKASQVADARGLDTDESLVTGRIGLAKSVLQAHRGELNSAKARYKRYVGRDPVGLRLPSQPKGIPTSLESVDLTQNWSYRAASKVADSREHDWKAVKARWAPQLNLEGMGGVGEDVQGIRGKDNSASFFLRGNWDLVDFSRRPMVRAAAARVEEGKALKDQALLEAEQECGEAWADLVSARAQRKSLSTYHTELSQVLQDYEKQFKVARRSFLNVLDIQNERFRAESSLVGVRFNERQSEFRILAVSGRLVAELGSLKL